jgi:hypothetical protein
MQKISSYLYPNRIDVVADVTLFPVRYKIVYQNNVKIYHGVDNVLTLDVKNADQKRIDISEMSLKMAVFDVNGKEVTTLDVTPSATTGLATVTITPADIIELTPQFLTYTIYRENEDESRTVLYADTNFGAQGKMEIAGTALTTATPPRYITAFNPMTDADARPPLTTYYSDAVDLRQPNFISAAADDSVELEFILNKANAVITVQFTKDTIINSTTVWSDVMSFGQFPEDVSVTKTISYPTYNREIAWMRVKFIQNSYKGYGATVDIGKRAAGLGFEATFLPNEAGKGYTVGETFTISAARFGGGGAWQLTVDEVNTIGGVTQWTPIAEQLVAEDGPVAYNDVPVSDPARAKAIDKVIVRL